MVGATALLLYFMRSGEYRLARWQGALFVSIYAAYMTVSFLLG